MNNKAGYILTGVCGLLIGVLLMLPFSVQSKEEPPMPPVSVLEGWYRGEPYPGWKERYERLSTHKAVYGRSIADDELAEMERVLNAMWNAKEDVRRRERERGK